MRTRPFIIFILTLAFVPLSIGAPSPFGSRIVGVRGSLASEAVRRHVEFSASVGFNALWVRSAEAGRWTAAEAPDGPFLEPEFYDFARRADELGMRIFLVVEPVSDSADRFVFSERDGAQRISRFLRLARREAGVHDFVISFRGAPLRLRELSDLLEYGRIAAPAHVELTKRIERKVGSKDRLWLAPAIFSDRHLDDPLVRYAPPLLESLGKLDPRVGIVWTGPQPISPSITADDLRAVRARLGGRRLILDDRYPANGSGERIPLALVLGPLRERDPGIAGEVVGYLSTPMGELGASRLALSTVADFLDAPESYDAEDSWRAAMKRLAGDDREAFEALRTQAAEWGGWIETRNYHTAFSDNPQTAARDLRDPALVASWTWTVRTYPERMAALESLTDEPFRADLMLTMARRLAIARCVPIVHELRTKAGDDDEKTQALLHAIREERERVREQPEVLTALDRFLIHAGLR
jgi:hypothetical protein